MTVQSAKRGSLAPYQPCSVQRLLQRTASRIPDKVAVIDGQRRFTHRQLDEYSYRLAASLIGLGIVKGDRVGFQIPPAELEGLLLEHHAAVIGKTDVETGEVPKALVVLKVGASASDQELMSFVGNKVANFKHIQEVDFVDSIPKKPSGNILRRLLIERERAKG